jgi:TetR/AcrR family transcriptional regulator, transcriptional repressor for nem operon
MARQKEFDREVVLERAMEAFWEQGYEATSVQDLVTSMGINRGSLYDTFGDKHKLYLEALDHYCQKNVRAMFNCLASAGSAKTIIEEFLYSFVVDPTQSSKGCLMTNTAVELGSHDADSRQRVLANYLWIEETFYQALIRGETQGEIAPGRDLRTLAQYLTSNLQGLRVMAKVDQDPEKIKCILGVILSVL